MVIRIILIMTYGRDAKSLDEPVRAHHIGIFVDRAEPCLPTVIVAVAQKTERVPRRGSRSNDCEFNHYSAGAQQLTCYDQPGRFLVEYLPFRKCSRFLTTRLRLTSPP